jgi:hypothetical protein
VPVEFLTDAEAAAYGRFLGSPSRAELERAFFLDDLDKELVARRRGDHNRLGFALQLTTVRWLGTFLPDPLEVPGDVVAYLAGQLDIADPACLVRYTERRTTRFEHIEEIKAAYELRDFPEVEKELEAWVDARAWTSGDGPKAIFNDAASWLAKRHVLLPGVTTLARTVARVRDQATERLYETLYYLVSDTQRRLLESVLDVPKRARSDLERWRKAPAEPTGRNLERALERVGEIMALGLSSLDLDAAVPHRRVVELARYGMAAYAPQLRRHPVSRRVATLACTLSYLEAKAVDDALELLDLLMANDLLAKAEKATTSERARQFTKLARASGLLARAWGAFLAAHREPGGGWARRAVGSDQAGRLPRGACRCRGNRARDRPPARGRRRGRRQGRAVQADRDGEGVRQGPHRGGRLRGQRGGHPGAHCHEGAA